MNRTTAAALVTAAVIGVSAGTVTAVVRGDNPAGKAPTAGPTTSRTPVAEEPTRTDPRELVLWADDTFVHDGEKQVGFPGTPRRAPDRVVRAQGGYVLAFHDEPGSPWSSTVYFVPAAVGTTQILAEKARTWDLAPEGDRIVVDTARNIQVVGLDGVVQATRAALKDETTVLWEDDTVTLHGLDREVGYRIWTWDPATGRFALTDRIGFANARTDRAGTQLFGAVNFEGYSGPEQNVCVGAAPATVQETTQEEAPQETGGTWFTCDWRLNGPTTNPVSPKGSRLLVIHSQSDGFGPGAFGIVDAAKGPSAGVPTVDIPDWSLDGAWVDEEHFAVVGSNSDDVGSSGGWIRLCDVAGDCEEVARTAKGRVTLGEQY